MNESDARFEFRCWARNFGSVDTRLRRISACHGIRESDEIYVATATKNDTNIKIRDGLLDIKELIETRGDLERWLPRVKCKFPVTKEMLEGDVLPRLGVALSPLRRSTYTLDQLLEDVVLPEQKITVAAVFKRRFAFAVNGCMAELDEVWTNGAGLHSVTIESTDPSAVLRARNSLRLDNLENVSYLQAVKRVTGMVPLRTPY